MFNIYHVIENYDQVLCSAIIFISHVCFHRIEYIGPLEVHATSGSIQTKKITLIDGDGVKINFLLWGEQVLLANLLR